MSRTVQHKTSFTGGELGPDLYGRDDLRAYTNGAARLRNVLVRPTGGVTRRPGLRYMADLPGPARLVPFDFNAEQLYLVAVGEGWIRVFRPQEGAPDATLTAPYTAEQLDRLDWTQSADTLLLAHPDVRPKRLVRRDGPTWVLEDLPFAEDTLDNGHTVKRVPFAKFGKPETLLRPGGTGATIDLAATEDTFLPDHVGTRFEIKGKQVEVLSVTDARSAVVSVKETLADTEETRDWGEEALSDLRGWPRTLVFHKDRLAIGGTRDLPHHLFLSRNAALFDFDTDEGQDDAAIDFPLLSDQVNAIQAVVSGRHLQILTAVGEWIVSGEPLTPKSVEAKPQTSIGTRRDRLVRPVVIDGATHFAGPGGEGLYEFLYTDLDQAYTASDLALLARHLAPKVRAMSYDGSRRLLYVVTDGGALACLTQYRSEQITAWTLCAIAGGSVAEVATLGTLTFVTVERAAGVTIEYLDETLQLDAALSGESAEPASQWSGLDHLEGETVAILADGCVRGPATVIGGSVTLERPATQVAIGKAFRHEIAPLPPVVRNNTGRDPAAAVRLIQTTLRLQDTGQLAVDLGRGLEAVPLAGFAHQLLDLPAPRFSGDKRLRAAGWRRADTAPLWRLEGEEPLPLTLLSVTNEMKVND